MAGDEMRAKANRNTQACIVAAAERLVRQMGYQKTMVADIAGILRMSPANVYRFFGSKRAIYEAVAARLMGEVETAAAASRPRTAKSSIGCDGFLRPFIL
jgi:AcrR family transcriptional regulator